MNYMMINLKEYINESKENKQYNMFIIIKPGFLSVKDEIFKIIEEDGWEIVNKKTFKMPHETAEKLYEMHKDKDFYTDLCDYMSSRRCICCTCFKDCKSPVKSMDRLKSKIRDKFGKDELHNCMHSSDSDKNVRREKNIIF